MKIKFGLLLIFVWAGLFSLTAQDDPVQKRQMSGGEFEYASQTLKTVKFTATDVSQFFFDLDDGGFTKTTQWDASDSESPYPVGLVSGTTPEVEAVFTNCPSVIWIKGIATLGAGTSSPIALTLPAKKIIPSGGDATYGPEIPKLGTGPMDFSFAAETVAYYEKWDIEWKFCDTNSTTESDWVSIETSSNPIYVTYAKPDELVPQLTVIHLGCTNANGISGPETTAGPAIVEAMFAPFEEGTFNVQRTSDNEVLTYYDPSASEACGNLVTMLASPDGDGRCGAMAELFYRMIKDQGLADGNGVTITHMGSLSGGQVIVKLTTASMTAIGADAMTQFGANDIIFDPLSQYYHFLVKEWSGYTEGSFFPLDGGDYEAAKSSLGDTGISGQGDITDPRSIFINHIYITYDGKIYDPSYGVTQSSTNLGLYEDASLDVVSGTIVHRMESGAPKYYFWVETENTSSQELQEVTTW